MLSAFALWFIAHAQTLTRDISIQPRSSGAASVLFLFHLSAGPTASLFRAQSDLDHDGMVSPAEAEVSIGPWLRLALADIELTADGSLAACDERQSFHGLDGSVQKGGFELAVLWECPPGAAFSLMVGAKMEGGIRFAPASVSAFAACPGCSLSLSAWRRADWLFVPGGFAMLGQ